MKAAATEVEETKSERMLKPRKSQTNSRKTSREAKTKRNNQRKRRADFRKTRRQSGSELDRRRKRKLMQRYSTGIVAGRQLLFFFATFPIVTYIAIRRETTRTG